MISSTYIRDYLLKKFEGKYKILSGGREMVIPSIFIPRDPKRHMSINLETGLWQCFKSQKKGNFIHLFADLENLSYKAAYNKFLVDEFFSEPKQEVSISASPSQAKIEEEFSNFKSLEVDRIGSIFNSEAVVYLITRGIINQGPFYYCDTGLYRGRIIIPYLHEGRTIFFQGRALYSDMSPKYLNYKGVKASSILYPFKYDSTEPLYICEGVFDAMSLKALGYNATTTLSCHVSKEQINQLKYYNGPLVVAYDNDQAGLSGLRSFEIYRRRNRMPKIYYTTVPSKHKDWNEAYLSNADAVHEACINYKQFNLNEWDTMTALDTLDQ
jgi:DNA primase